MHPLQISACILLFVLGYLFRDGFPATGSTQLARLIGGVICTMGALAVHPDLIGLALGASVYVGFYCDQKHGDGQGATGWRDAGWLLLSGVSSLVPLSIACWFLLGSPWPHTTTWVILAGALKPAIWFGTWAARPDLRWSPWLEPTRVSAMLFGALVGAVVALT